MQEIISKLQKNIQNNPELSPDMKKAYSDFLEAFQDTKDDLLKEALENLYKETVDDDQAIKVFFHKLNRMFISYIKGGIQGVIQEIRNSLPGFQSKKAEN